MDMIQVENLTKSFRDLRRGRVLGVDLNADHLACCVLDASGNPIGEPTNIEVRTAGLGAAHRDGRVRAAIIALLDHAQNSGCGAVVVENLDFNDARATGRDTLGRGRRGKRLRRTIAGIPTRRFRNRLTAMSHETSNVTDDLLTQMYHNSKRPAVGADARPAATAGIKAGQ